MLTVVCICVLFDALRDAGRLKELMVRGETTLSATAWKRKRSIGNPSRSLCLVKATA
jgi:hypothetical protein